MQQTAFTLIMVLIIQADAVEKHSDHNISSSRPLITHFDPFENMLKLINSELMPNDTNNNSLPISRLLARRYNRCNLNHGFDPIKTEYDPNQTRTLNHQLLSPFNCNITKAPLLLPVSISPIPTVSDMSPLPAVGSAGSRSISDAGDPNKS
eukprot:221728_1